MTEDDLDKFIKCLGMLSSSHTGEALNARDKCDHILKKYKLTWADVPNLRASKSYSAEDRATQERARENQARQERERQERERQEERAREEREKRVREKREREERELAERQCEEREREEQARHEEQEREERERAERAREEQERAEREEAAREAALKQEILTTGGKHLVVASVVAIVIGGSVGWLAGGAYGWLAFVGVSVMCVAVGLDVSRRGLKNAIDDDELRSQPNDAVAERSETARPPPASSVGARRFTNIIARNWRGELPLWVAYWVFGFFGNIIIGLIPVLAVKAFSDNAGYEPRTIFATLVATWLGVLIIATWQLVGVWRSASRHIEQRNRAGRLAPWAGLAKLAVILGILRLVGEFGNAGVPQITEASRMAFMDDPSMPAYSIRIMRNGTEVEITGGFKYGLTDDFLRILRASPQIQVVHLNSMGGRIGEAEKLNKIIRDHGFLTYVSYQCVSACTVAFAGGRERWLRDGASLGFHAPAFPGMSDADLVEAASEQKDLFAAAGFAPGFVNRALATPNKDMWRPSSDELFRAGAITAVSDGSNFAASGYGGNVTREEMAAMLTKVLPVLATMKERLPTDYASIIDGFYDSYVSGQTQTEIFAAARSKLLRIIAAYRPFANDAVLVELGKLFAEQSESLGSKNPTLCYLYASGAGGARNFSPDIPASLIQRETILGERVIATAAKRPAVSEQMINSLWKKVGVQLAKRVRVENIKVTKLDPSKYADYCAASVALFQEITNLKQNEAGLLMRQILSSK